MNSDHKNEPLFLQAFQYAPIGIALVSLDGKWLKVNRALCRLLGYSEEELLARSFQSMTHEADLEKDLTLVQQLLRGEIDSYQLEKRYVGKDGQLVWALLSVSLVVHRDGTPKYFISQIVDFTETKKAHFRIERLTEQMSSMLESITDSFFSLDRDWRFVYVNREAERHFGLSRALLGGQRFWDIFPETQGTPLETQLRQAAASRQKLTFRDHLPGSDQWFELNLYPSDDGLSVYFQNVTSRKEMEQQLIESERSFRLLAEYSTDMIARQTPDGRFAYVSPVSEALLGYTAEKLVGTSSFDYIHPDDLSVARESLCQIVHTLEIQTVAYRVRHREGHYVWFETTSRSVRDDAHQVIEIITVSRDISERKEAELRMREQHARLRQLSMLDGLTGIANRRAFDETLQRAWASLKPLGQPCSLLLCDIDYFKAYNDTYGHLGGDVCLQQVAAALNTPPEAIPGLLTARYGGEEFALLLPGLDLSEAEKMAHWCRDAVLQLGVRHQGSPVSPLVTVSIGVATVHPDSEATPQQLIERADAALYLAKRRGRNQAALAEERGD